MEPMKVEIGVFIQYVSNAGYEIIEAQASDANKYISNNRRAYASAGGPSIVSKGHARSPRKDILNNWYLLFTEFAELGHEPENIITFANKYGLLLPSPTFGTLNTKETTELAASADYADGERLSFWSEQIFAMHAALQAWRWVEDNNVKALQSSIKINPGQITYSFSFPDNSYCAIPIDLVHLRNRDNTLKLDQLRNGSVFLQAKFFVQQMINKQARNFPVEPCLIFDEDNNLIQRYRPSSLLSFMWYQFYRYVTGEQKVQQCPQCHRWDDVRDESGNIRWTSICTQCSKKLRTQKSEIKKQYLIDRMPADEIIKRRRKGDENTIREWIAEFENTIPTG